MANKFIIMVTFFYLLFIIGISVLGFDEANEVLTPPTMPDIPIISDIPIIGGIVSFGAYIGFVVAWFGRLTLYSFTNLVHPLISIIIFIPMGIFIIWNLIGLVTGGN